MAYDAKQLLGMSQAQLDDLFRSNPAGDIPNGSANGTAIIESIIDMAHRIGLQVVGEGVENRTQQNLLVDLDCDEFQGFYFSPPMPSDAVDGFIESSQKECAGVCELV